MRKPVSSRIRYILDKHYDKKQLAKCEHMAEHLFDFTRYWVTNEALIHGFSTIKVISLVESYFYDVIRYKEYHNDPHDPVSEDEKNKKTRREFKPDDEKPWLFDMHEEEKGQRINKSKIAAFTAKWFLKNLPIFIYPDPKIANVDLSEKERKDIIFCNEFFLLEHICKLLEIPFAELKEQDLYDLVYSFKFRHFEIDSYILIFQDLERKYKGNL
jgi:hypothetical protein